MNLCQNLKFWVGEAVISNIHLSKGSFNIVHLAFYSTEEMCSVGAYCFCSFRNPQLFSAICECLIKILLWENIYLKEVLVLIALWGMGKGSFRELFFFVTLYMYIIGYPNLIVPFYP